MPARRAPPTTGSSIQTAPAEVSANFPGGNLRRVLLPTWSVHFDSRLVALPHFANAAIVADMAMAQPEPIDPVGAHAAMTIRPAAILRVAPDNNGPAISAAMMMADRGAGLRGVVAANIRMAAGDRDRGGVSRRYRRRGHRRAHAGQAGHGGYEKGKGDGHFFHGVSLG